MSRAAIMLAAAGIFLSGICLKPADARKEKTKKKARAEEGAKEETQRRKRRKSAGTQSGPAAGPEGVDSRITLTPVTDGSCDWKYKPVLLNPDIVGPSEISCIIQIPDWVPADKREDPSARYYIYHSNHGGGSILMNWAESMEDLVAGHLPKVQPITIESSTLLPPDGKRAAVGGWIRTPMTLELEGAMHLKPLHIGHISAPDIYIDHGNKRFVLFFHGFDKGQFLDLPAAEIEAAGGLNGIGRHMHFAATSPYARNFNAARVNGIECGGHEGYGPICSVDGYHSDRRKRMVVWGYRYGKHFTQHGRFYTMGREGRLSRAPETNPFNPAANGHTANDYSWMPETSPDATSYNRLCAVQDWMKAGEGVVMAERLKLQNHPKNPHPGTRPAGDINHVAINRINDTHFEIFVISKGSQSNLRGTDKDDGRPVWQDIYRVVLDATSKDWKDWHLEHDENGVIFDVVVDHKILFEEYNATHGTSIALNPGGSLANPSVFIDNKATPKETRYLTFSYAGTGKTKDGESIGHAHGIIRLDPVAEP